MGADIAFENARELSGEPVADIRVRHAALNAIDLPPEAAADMIDEFPILFIAAAFASGTTRTSGLGELRVKESDRIAAMAAGLGRIGVRAEETEDGLIVHGSGGDPLPGGGAVETHLDHRIAMSFAIAALHARAAVTIDDMGAAATSFPRFHGGARRPRRARGGMSFALDRRAFIGALGGAALLPRLAFAQDAPAAAIPPPDREAMVPVEGGRVYVRVNGALDGPRPPILMIHGGPGGSHASFLNALPLADERAVILYDQLDCGRSDTPNDPRNWRVARFVDEVDAIRRALGLTRLHVLGASWGGTVALEYAARRPAGLASAILESPLVSTRSWIADANILRTQLRPAVQATLTRCEHRPAPPTAACEGATSDFYAHFLARRPSDPARAAYARALPVPFNARLYNTMWGSSEFVCTGTLRDYDGEPLLARLDGARTFFVCGQYDEARPATLAGFATRVPGASLAAIEDAGHAILNDNPEALLFHLRRWLRGHDA
jgi:proline iminopeptidase/L-proline amide hydrolase